MPWRYVLLAIALLLPADHVFSQRTEEAKKPVILLTGFEPFGASRPPNPSWEGVRQLDGQTWRGRKLVARQLPVVWGAPPEHLQAWLEELEPVAVFSFGQGGGYALETVADNARLRAEDNAGKLPPELAILANGPKQLTATIDAKAMIEILSTRGYEVRLSREAGNYLCEECLYSLEHLKAQQKRKLTVSFCHLPPLAGGKYEPKDAQQFVLAFLEAWHELSADIND